jgi:hypothetical protein
MVRSLVVSTALVAISLGCASATSGGVGETRRSQILTQEEISSSGASGNAFDVVTRLRPNFLASRGPTTLGNAQSTAMYPNIYLDGIPYGDINTLRNIDASQIAEMRLYQAGEAQTKFGMGNNGGVIAITTRR